MRRTPRPGRGAGFVHWSVLLEAVVIAFLTGCHGAIRADCGGDEDEPDFGGFTPVPAIRIGSIPFPSIVSLYASADPDRLGDHVYRAGAPFEGVTETERGMVYTCRAGFVDIAHVRNTIDNAGHIHARLRHALREGWGCVRFRVAEPSVWRVEIDYPDSWWAMGETERLERADELAARAAETLALHTMTWHEILTWYGYKSAVIVDERPSAFTYEDSTSHAVGALVAGRALRAMVAHSLAGADELASFSAAVTAELDAELHGLGIVDQGVLADAVDAVEGEWWSGLAVRRRHIECGVAGEPIEPWLAPGIGPCVGETAEVFTFAPLAQLGLDGPSPVLRALIRPRVSEKTRMLADLREFGGLAERPDVVDVEAGFPVLLERIRADYREREGPESLRP